MYWSRSRRGVGVSTRRTARKRLCRTQQAVWRWGHSKRHAPWQYQYQQLGQTFRGHCQSCGLRGHVRRREAVRRSAEQAWRYGLSRRRSQRPIDGETFPQRLATSGLPTPTIVHTI